MKKFLAIFFVIMTCLSSSTSAYFQDDIWYEQESIEAFINSPSQEDLVNIEDEETRYCEQVYLEAYRRREFTQEETLLCGDLFELKQAQEMSYMYFYSFGY